MSESFVVAICTLGENSNLKKCLTELINIKSKSKFKIEILLVINRIPYHHNFDSQVLVVFEPTRGYASVRNAAIVNMTKNANLIYVGEKLIIPIKEEPKVDEPITSETEPEKPKVNEPITSETEPEEQPKRYKLPKINTDELLSKAPEQVKTKIKPYPKKFLHANPQSCCYRSWCRNSHW
jgi:hypothetical protein